MITIVVHYAPGVVPRFNVAAFCSFLIIFARFFLVLFKAHLAIVVKVSELALSRQKAKNGRLAKELDAPGLIHRNSKVSITIIHCHI